MEDYGQAKLGLFTRAGLRHALINLDDDFAARVQSAVAPGVQVLSYSIANPGADVFVEQAEFGADGVRGVLRTPWGSGAFHSPLPGDFNLANLAAAVCAAVLAGEPLDGVLDGVAGLRPVPGRMQSLPNDQGLQVIIDYAHTPDALQQVLASLKPHVPGELIAVFGCGGDRDRDKRQPMGRIACHLANRVVVTSDNPRSEDPQAILADIAHGCSGQYQLQVDRAVAIESAILSARAGDCVVIAGKGHEDYQIIEGEYLHFSDEQVASAALAARAAR
jgi:UDP-N-acetylmuramoyl-L-alanyl-D-glutamate--2,6-diaminopimelate ligase